MTDVCAICGREILPLEWFVQDEDARHMDCAAAKDIPSVRSAPVDSVGVHSHTEAARGGEAATFRGQLELPVDG